MPVRAVLKRMPALPAPRSGMSLDFIPESRLLVGVGGAESDPFTTSISLFGSGMVPQQTLFKFDVMTNVWEATTHTLAVARSLHAHAVHAGKLYVWAGQLPIDVVRIVPPACRQTLNGFRQN